MQALAMRTTCTVRVVDRENEKMLVFFGDSERDGKKSRILTAAAAAVVVVPSSSFFLFFSDDATLSNSLSPLASLSLSLRFCTFCFY